MSTRIFNLTSTSAPIPGPNFFWARDTDGKCSGRHTFTLVRGALSNPTNQARFRKGVSIISLDPSLGAFFSFLTIDSFDAQDIPGGYTEVTVNVSGYSEGGDFEFDREISYSSNNSLGERSMLENPMYRAAVTSPLERHAFAQVYNGMAHGECSFNGSGALSSVAIKSNIDPDTTIVTITHEDYLEWYDRIFIKDERTFLTVTYEWVKTTANAGGLTSAELANLGKIDDPPGNPPTPPDGGPDYTWLKTAANEVRGESSASTEEAWTWGYWPDKVYFYEGI